MTNFLPSTFPRRSAISLRIERLILDGVPLDAHHAALLKTSVETELARLLAAYGLASRSSGAETSIAGSEIRLATNATPQQLGKQIGRSVYAAFNPSVTTTQPSNGDLI